MDNRTFTVRVTSNGFVVVVPQEDGTVLEWVFESVASLARFFGERTDVRGTRPRSRGKNGKGAKKITPEPVPLLVRQYDQTEE